MFDEATVVLNFKVFYTRVKGLLAKQKFGGKAG